MKEVVETIKILAPFMIISWLVLAISMLRNVQRYFNSILLMIALFFTALFITGMFGDHMGTALLVLILVGGLFLLVVPGLLLINGLQVLRKESFSFAHLLSLLLGLGIGAGEVALIMGLLNASFVGPFNLSNKTLILFGATAFYGSLLILNFVVYSIFIQLLPYKNRFNAVIIHGCGLLGGEKVSKLLANRCDKAIQIYNKSEVKPVIIASGGQGSDEKISEAEAMRRYLVEKGIPAQAIILEDKSTTTLENLINSKKLIEEKNLGKRVALVSSNYHVYRCLSLARSVGIKCRGIGAKVALYYWPTALIREFVAVMLKPKFMFWSLLCYILFILPIWALIR